MDQPNSQADRLHRQIQRFLASGAAGAAAHFCTLAFFVEIVGLDVVIATSIAFIVGSSTSFVLQKLWTFRNRTPGKIRYQMATYLSVALWNLALNGAAMDRLVHHLHIYYLLAQVITSSVIAVESFLLYKHFVFKHKAAPTIDSSP